MRDRKRFKSKSRLELESSATTSKVSQLPNMELARQSHEVAKDKVCALLGSIFLPSIVLMQLFISLRLFVKTSFCIGKEPSDSFICDVRTNCC